MRIRATATWLALALTCFGVENTGAETSRAALEAAVAASTFKIECGALARNREYYANEETFQLLEYSGNIVKLYKYRAYMHFLKYSGGVSSYGSILSTFKIDLRKFSVQGLALHVEPVCHIGLNPGSGEDLGRSDSVWVLSLASLDGEKSILEHREVSQARGSYSDRSRKNEESFKSQNEFDASIDTIELTFLSAKDAEDAERVFREAIVTAQSPDKQAAERLKSDQIQARLEDQKGQNEESAGDHKMGDAIIMQHCLVTNCKHSDDEINFVSYKCLAAKESWNNALKKARNAQDSQRLRDKVNHTTGITCGEGPSPCTPNGTSEDMFQLANGEVRRVPKLVCGQSNSKSPDGLSDLRVN